MGGPRKGGPVDAADFKTYIFPLLFFKRICDVWDEEYQEIVDETGDEQLAWFPESHRFQIPEDCHWNDVRTKASNVGATLQRAMREIETANSDTLYVVIISLWICIAVQTTGTTAHPLGVAREIRRSNENY